MKKKQSTTKAPPSQSRTDAAEIDPLIDELPSRYVVGIDLGTTNSAVTWIDTEEKPWQIRVLSIAQLVASGETESLDTLPSFHYQPPSSLDGSALKMPWDEQTPIACVGAWARDEMTRTSGRGIASAKSWLCHAAVDRTAPLLPWQAAADVKRFSPVEISAAYLSHIRACWDQQFKKFPLDQQDIVLTLPASFDEVARALTIEAAAQAGLKRVVLIEEPQAAFYAWVNLFSSEGDANWRTKVHVGQKILVCDIGGGTTDLTLIRVRKAELESAEQTSPNNADSTVAERIQFHRVAVGNHLILGGDNLDLAIAKHVEAKLTDGGQLESHQWDVLLGNSRNVKERMLSADAPDSMTINLPGRGSKLIGGSLQADVTRDEIRTLILAGFLPEVALTDRPEYHASGFQEFGLPFASDPAITRYVADFLMQHAAAGLDQSADDDGKEASAHPDIILFNGGFFASDVLRSRLIDQIAEWFRPTLGSDWAPEELENDRLDLAVARGAAYYGMVRRDEGVSIAASLARSYYIGIGDGQAVCIMPGSAQSGQSYRLQEQTFMLTISQPVEFSIFVSSVRLADAPGQIVTLDPQQLRPLPPIRTVLKVKSRNEKRTVAVKLQIALTELGTIELSCHEIETDRAWKLQFDVRSTTQTDVAAHDSAGETEGFVDEPTWMACCETIERVFTKDHADPLKPNQLVRTLSKLLDADRDRWPMSVLRRIWETLMEHRDGRRISASHEARWLNLLGYSLRPGYGIALDDWRVSETWRHVRGNLVHGASNIQTESLILWRRLSGGLSAGQQKAIAQPLLASIKSLAKQMSGKVVKGNAIAVKPEDSTEVWRLLGSLELLSVGEKIELANLIVELKDKKRLSNARPAMIWALGRLGQRKPFYGPLNTVVPADDAQVWVNALMQNSNESSIFPIVQMCRRTGDRYHDIDEGLRANVLKWLVNAGADKSFISLVEDGGEFETQQKSQVFGESLPAGLRLA